jgi:hypothetical protein
MLIQLLSDPHEAINILNDSIDVKQQIALWFQEWVQTQPLDMGPPNESE